MLSRHHFYAFCLLLLFCSCSRTFVAPDITEVPYTPAGTAEDQLDFDLSEAPLEFSEPFSKKLDRKDMLLYTLRISNPSRDTIWLRPQQLQLYAGDAPVAVVAPRQVYRALRQPVAIHALWLLIGPFFRTDNGERSLDYHPLGVGFVAWGVRNALVAYVANQQVEELIEATIPAGDTPVPPGDTFYMLLPLEAYPPAVPLRLRYTAPADLGIR